ncbi:hypothetical protein CLAFUR4_02161 [Fulvia fulva]|nr:hypothetical protein CLAFUR4_02161 [Fulvia fulva]KAK4638032.1 hypothetical protein CLAFUR0_02164 [Fulvia fulva]WPV24719.1 hypothetical protein CLAFUW7_02165 [Fulvia fulva]
MRTMNHSPLLRLSAELRNVIYEHTFTSQYAVTLCSGKVQHPLTKTCRQIRHETLPMYYAVTKFNAHLDDGPATPLAKWLKTQAPELVLCMNGLVIWSWISGFARILLDDDDMRNLNYTLHGTESTSLLLETQPAQGKHYTLRPVGSWILEGGFHLKEICIALQDIGLSLSRFCITDETGDSRFRLTSEFAIVALNPVPVDLAATDDHIGVNEAARQIGLSDRARGELIQRVANGHRRVRLVDGRRVLMFQFAGDRGIWLQDVKEML